MSDRTVFLALGSNLGDRAGWLAFATERLAAIPGFTLVATTPTEETAPLDGADQPPYLNAMVRGRFDREAEALLADCHAIEAEAGRDRVARWASRTLDIDLVRCGDLLCDRPDLTLPHPGLRDRPFWASQLALLEHHD